MPLDLRKLLGLSDKPDVESKTAAFYLNVPHVAPLAYHHVLHVPALEETLEATSSIIDIPEIWKNFLRYQNGAALFSGSVRIDGVVAKGQLFSRKDPYFRLPFDLEKNNLQYQRRRYAPPNGILIGDYGFDRTLIYLNRLNGVVHAQKEHTGKIVATWASPEQWVHEEIGRLSLLFDNTGRCLVDRSQTLPSRSTHPIM